MKYYQIQYAYIAGALDGDGSFSLIKGATSAVSPLYYPMIQLANADKNIVDLFITEFGGSYNLRNRYLAKDGHWRKESHQWKLEKRAKCLPVLKKIIPYLCIKKERAQFLHDYIIENPFIRGSNPLSCEVLERRENAYLLMRSFNDIPANNTELYKLDDRSTSNDPIFWAYVAGLMDTDGSFSLKKENRKAAGRRSPVYTASILLSMTDCKAICKIMNNFLGGSMFTIKAKTAMNGFCFRFSITSRKKAIIFLERCIPFLIIKNDIAQKLLEFCESTKQMNGKLGVSKEELTLREEYYTAIRRLNNKNYN
jgi:hypothetical protein